MGPYFIRHKLKGDEYDLCDAHRIAIDFENLPVPEKQTELDPDHFRDLPSRYASAYRTALNYMINLRDLGGYVFAEYGRGYIGKNRSEDIGCILARIEPQDRFEAFAPSNKKYSYQVSLQLNPNSIGYIRYSDFPVLLAIRPPFSTICQPSRTYQEIASAFFDRQRIPGSKALELIHPKMVEQLCVEYLRQKGHKNHKLDYCALRPGKSLAIIDIAGRLTNKQWIFAQVKNASLSQSYSAELACELERFIGKSDEERAEGVLFGSFDKGQSYDGPISFVDLNDVLEYFRQRQSTILEDMIGFRAIETDDGPVSMEVDWDR